MRSPTRVAGAGVGREIHHPGGVPCREAVGSPPPPRRLSPSRREEGWRLAKIPARESRKGSRLDPARPSGAGFPPHAAEFCGGGESLSNSPLAGCPEEALSNPAVERVASWDRSIFHWINHEWSHPLLDPVMRFLSHNPFFLPALAILTVALVWKGGPRGVVFVFVLLAAAGLGNALLVDPLKDFFGRPRPFHALSEVTVRVGRGTPMASMPSGHAMLSSLVATITGWFYPRTLWLVGPAAIGVGISRIYNGVHYPSDVLVGTVMGVAFALVFLRAAEWVWTTLGPRKWPRLAERVPSLLRPGRAWAIASAPAFENRPAERSDVPGAGL
jgi:undecaprenyl-diphosphatase